MINVIRKDFGEIIELEKNNRRSIAMVCVDPGRKKSWELHMRTTEKFENVQGQGRIATARGTRNISREGQRSTVESGVPFQLKNTGNEFWIMYITCRPPYDPADEY